MEQLQLGAAGQSRTGATAVMAAYTPTLVACMQFIKAKALYRLWRQLKERPPKSSLSISALLTALTNKLSLLIVNRIFL